MRIALALLLTFAMATIYGQNRDTIEIDGVGGADTHLGNSNLSVTGDRVVDFNGANKYDAVFQNIGNFTYGAQLASMVSTNNMFLTSVSGDIILSADQTSFSSILKLNNVTAPGAETDAIQLYAEDVSSSSELKVRDEAGNTTTLSPHNFSLIGEPSNEMAWSYYSERDGKAINVDMFRVVQLLEEITGEKLIHIKSIK